ncbi:MAG: polysaccharide biosynthesis C-terminal domain-containing protein [Alphaproteobacteria bacterium]|nr:polysaccharide biosynthesis C-terminal domain-containing protein [Alphaproteobacteria bacterium]
MRLNDLKLFFNYVIPTMFSTLIWGSYSIVDAIFVGHSAGTLSLTALNLSYPIAMIAAAVGSLTGYGAGVLVGQFRGAKKLDRAADILGVMVVGQIAICAVLIPLMYFLLPEFLMRMGAAGLLLEEATVYGRLVCLGAVTTMLCTGLTVVIRNDGHPRFAMMLDVTGLLLNILLDFLFVVPLNWGLVGAAWAIVIAETVQTAGGVAYFKLKKSHLPVTEKRFRLNLKDLFQIVRVGIPAFGQSLSMMAFLSFHNYQALKYGGENGLAACAVVNEVVALILLLVSGLAQGVQPLVSYLHGARSYWRQNMMGRWGYYAGIITGIGFVALMIFGADLYPRLFDVTGVAAEEAINGLHICAWSFLFYGIIQVAASYYQATNKILYSSLLIYGDTFFMLPLCLFTLPIWFGLNGVWLALPVSRVLLFLCLMGMWGKRLYKKFEKQFPSLVTPQEPITE